MSQLTVRDLMTETVKTVTRTTPLREVRDLMYEGNFRHVPVVEDDEVVGLVSDRDLGRVLGRTSGGRREELLEEMAVALMMTWPVETVDPDEPIGEAGERMLEGKFGCLPVVEGRHLVGILTETDFVRHVVRR